MKVVIKSALFLSMLYSPLYFFTLYCISAYSVGTPRTLRSLSPEEEKKFSDFYLEFKFYSIFVTCA